MGHRLAFPALTIPAFLQAIPRKLPHSHSLVAFWRFGWRQKPLRQVGPNDHTSNDPRVAILEFRSRISHSNIVNLEVF